MQTKLADLVKNSPTGAEADQILRSCVHCGFCTATCPTYLLLGDELDSPRGRIYLIKQMLEGEPVGERTQLHLDRCLTCRSCETTCPSGVRYGRLLDIGREMVELAVRRPWLNRLQRWMLRVVLPYPQRFEPLLRFAQHLSPALPRSIRAKIPLPAAALSWPAARHVRKMLVLEGCVQPALAPAINGAAAQVLDRLGISLVRAESAGCCGAVSYHLSAQEEGLAFMRRNIDAWIPHLDGGVEAIVITASGCGVMVKDYVHALQHDPVYAEKAARISAAARDLAEVVSSEDFSKLRPVATERQNRLAFQSPCTLQHGLKLSGIVEDLLTQLGFQLTFVPDAHLCCGSAGTYSLLQPDLSTRLLSAKLNALTSGEPDVIVTANIGCLTQLQSRSDRPVMHWIELLV